MARLTSAALLPVVRTFQSPACPSFQCAGARVCVGSFDGRTDGRTAACQAAGVSLRLYRLFITAGDCAVRKAGTQESVCLIPRVGRSGGLRTTSGSRRGEDVLWLRDAAGGVCTLG